jgi:hypothetical protein
LRESYVRQFDREVPLREIVSKSGVDKDRFVDYLTFLKDAGLFRSALTRNFDLNRTVRIGESIGKAASASKYFQTWCDDHFSIPKPERKNPAVQQRHEIRREQIFGGALAMMATQRDKCWDEKLKRFTAQKIFVQLELHVEELFGEDAELPLGKRRAIDHLNEWLKILTPHKN